MVEENSLQESTQGQGIQESSSSSSGNCSLRQAIDFISSLISLSYSIKVFAAKWQLIRNKLEELNSGLIAAENCDSEGENTAFSGLVPAILATVKECCDLARRCVDLSYSGKLMMQSDLDVILSKFDCHVKNLSGIYTAGILHHKYALVVSKPGVGACKDDMRFYVRDLLTRMKVGDLDMKRQALVNLHEIVIDDEKYVRIIVEDDDVIGLLINLLDSPEMEFQEESAKILSVIASFDSYKGVLVTAGTIAPLVRVLEGSDLGKEAAAKCLQRLTENSDNGWSVSAHGGVTALLKICSNTDCKGELIAPTCGVLRNLVGVEEIKRFMLEEGAISTVIKLTKSKDEIVQVSSIDLLHTIVYNDEAIKQMVIKEGGTRALLRFLDSNLSFSSKIRETAFRAIESIFFSSVSSVNILLNYGFMDHILYFLRYGEVSVQELALKAVYRLCGTSEEAKKAMGNAGFMAELVKMLEAKSMEAREMAAEALSRMVLVPKNRKKFVQDDHNIGTILQLLDPEQGLTGSQKLLLSILMSLTSCNSGRRKIANSGYLKKVEKLAEAEGSDAKRLVRKLSTNRLRSMFSGFWHS